MAKLQKAVDSKTRIQCTRNWTSNSNLTMITIKRNCWMKSLPVTYLPKSSLEAGKWRCFEEQFGHPRRPSWFHTVARWPFFGCALTTSFSGSAPTGGLDNTTKKPDKALGRRLTWPFAGGYYGRLETMITEYFKRRNIRQACRVQFALMELCKLRTFIWRHTLTCRKTFRSANCSGWKCRACLFTDLHSVKWISNASWQRTTQNRNRLGSLRVFSAVFFWFSIWNVFIRGRIIRRWKPLLGRVRGRQKWGRRKARQRESETAKWRHLRRRILARKAPWPGDVQVRPTTTRHSKDKWTPQCRKSQREANYDLISVLLWTSAAADLAAQVRKKKFDPTVGILVCACGSSGILVPLLAAPAALEQGPSDNYRPIVYTWIINGDRRTHERQDFIPASPTPIDKQRARCRRAEVFFTYQWNSSRPLHSQSNKVHSPTYYKRNV